MIGEPLVTRQSLRQQLREAIVEFDTRMASYRDYRDLGGAQRVNDAWIRVLEIERKLAEMRW